MNKSGTLIITALLTLGLAAASMAADVPKSAAPMAADTGTAAPADATKAHKSSKSSKSGASSKSGKSSKSHKKSTTTTPPAAAK
ncbi:MAG TPA: hypothetical protein VNY80_03875 [Steroidobacteraceae bacterium]|jgi:hypothetical protein|nr:hypothetical protein [Steroidobacteraceae bacterium]